MLPFHSADKGGDFGSSVAELRAVSVPPLPDGSESMAGTARQRSPDPAMVEVVASSLARIRVANRSTAQHPAPQEPVAVLSGAQTQQLGPRTGVGPQDP